MGFHGFHRTVSFSRAMPIAQFHGKCYGHEIVYYVVLCLQHETSPLNVVFTAHLSEHHFHSYTIK